MRSVLSFHKQGMSMTVISGGGLGRSGIDGGPVMEDGKGMTLQSLPHLLRLRSTEMVGSLELGSAIGRGSYGKVFKGVYT